MRILLTTDTIGGVWTFTRDLTVQLLQRGHAVALVSFGRIPGSHQAGWCSKIAAQYGGNFVFRASDTPLEWMMDNASAFTGGADLMLQLADDFDADLLHANQFCWGALPGDLPRVISAHSDVMSWAASCRAEPLEDSAWLRHYLALVQRGLDAADAVVAPTAWMRNALLHHFQVRCPFQVIANGRAISSLANVHPRKLQAVTVGRLWDEAKGVRTLLDAELPVPVLIAGEEEFEGTRATPGSLLALGILNESQLIELFRASSIYIATSLYEPFGLSPLEAALCGCAVVARDLASLREVWGDAALFYDTTDELAALLQRLATNPQMLRAAQESSKVCAQRYTADRMACAFETLYASLITHSQGASPQTGEIATHAA